MERRLLHFSALKTNGKTKSITARGKMRGRTERLPCGMFFSMQKGFTAICEAFLWCRFTMTQATDDAAAGSLSSFEEFSGEYRNNKKTVKK